VPGIDGQNNQVVVYPNPSGGLITFEVNNKELIKENNSVEIYNMLGQQIRTNSLTGKTTELDLSSQPSGIYLYRVLSENGKLVSEGKFTIAK
jgi:hypothetical protein